MNQYKYPEIIPYQDIHFCSNHFRNMKSLIEDNGFYPLLIGKGDFPRVWIFAKNKQNSVIEVIKDSVAILPETKVNIYSEMKKMTISVYSFPDNKVYTMLEANYNSDIPNITYIDLQPIGYVVTGNENELTIGNLKISQSTIGGDDGPLSSIVKIDNTK